MASDSHETLGLAREAYSKGEWSDAADLFLRADVQEELRPDDLERLVWAAAVAARDADMLSALERVYGHSSAAGDHEKSARAAFWSGLRNMMMGEVGLGAGWLQRASVHVEKTEPDCVERGYLMLPQVFADRARGDYEAAVDSAEAALSFGRRCNEPDLIALAGSLKGGILFRLGRIDEGYVPIDETMLLANGGHLSPVVTGVGRWQTNANQSPPGQCRCP